MNLELSRVWSRCQAMLNGIIISLPDMMVSILVFALFVVCAGWAKAIVMRAVVRYGRSRSVGVVVGRLLQWLVLMAGVLVALSFVAPSFTARDLINLLGIGGVAIGFAFREILQNFLAGILLLLTEPFRIGDQIVITGFEGTVEEIETRATILKTYDNARVVIPNATLFTQSVSVNTALNLRRSEYEFKLERENDVELAKRSVLETIRSVAGVAPHPEPDILVNALPDLNVSLVARWWTASGHEEILTVRDRVLIAVRNRLAELGLAGFRRPTA